MNVGRPLKSDPDNAVDPVMRVFCSQGSDATSLQGLLSATKPSKSSLYQAIGSGQILFDRWVDLSRDNLAEQRRVQLARENSRRRFIEDAFGTFLAKAGSPSAVLSILGTYAPISNTWSASRSAKSGKQLLGQSLHKSFERACRSHPAGQNKTSLQDNYCSFSPSNSDFLVETRVNQNR